MLLIHNSSFAFVLSTRPCASSHPSPPLWLPHPVQPAVTELPYSKDLFTASILKHTELGEKVEYLRLGWWCCKAEFLVRPESRQLQVQLYGKLQAGWKLCCGAILEQRLDNINVITSDKTLTAGWSFQYGWPWAGSWCPGWKGSTHPRKSTGSQRRHGLEVGTTYWPHGCRGTSSGSWRYRRWKRGWQTERKNLRAQCDDQRVLVLKWECSLLMGSIF